MEVRQCFGEVRGEIKGGQATVRRGRKRFEDVRQWSGEVKSWFEEVRRDSEKLEEVKRGSKRLKGGSKEVQGRFGDGLKRSGG